MPKVSFTAALTRFFPDLQPEDFSGASVAEVLASIDSAYPGLKDYLVDDRGCLRKHINIFIGDELVRDRTGLTDPLSDQDELLIFQALSGG